MLDAANRPCHSHTSSSGSKGAACKVPQDEGWSGRHPADKVGRSSAFWNDRPRTTYRRARHDRSLGDSRSSRNGISRLLAVTQAQLGLAMMRQGECRSFRGSAMSSPPRWLIVIRAGSLSPSAGSTMMFNIFFHLGEEVPIGCTVESRCRQPRWQTPSLLEEQYI